MSIRARSEPTLVATHDDTVGFGLTPVPPSEPPSPPPGGLAPGGKPFGGVLPDETVSPSSPHAIAAQNASGRRKRRRARISLITYQDSIGRATRAPMAGALDRQRFAKVIR